METTATLTPIYGLTAEFEDPDQLIAAAEKVRAAGYRRVDAYTPFPVHGLAEVLAVRKPLLPWLIFFAGCTGAMAGFTLQLFTATPLLEPILKQPFITDVVIRNIPYPMNIGGRPYISWPSFIPVTFELTILLAAGMAVVGMIALNGLPKPYHSVFNAPGFDRATLDRFFLCIELGDPKFDLEDTAHFLRGLGAAAVSEVER